MHHFYGPLNLTSYIFLHVLQHLYITMFVQLSRGSLNRALIDNLELSQPLVFQALALWLSKSHAFQFSDSKFFFLPFSFFFKLSHHANYFVIHRKFFNVGSSLIHVDFLKDPGHLGHIYFLSFSFFAIPLKLQNIFCSTKVSI